MGLHDSYSTRSIRFRSRPHKDGGANVPPNSPPRSTILRTGTLPVPSAAVFAALAESHPPMAGCVSARVSGLPPASASAPSSSAKTCAGATLPIWGSQQNFRKCLSHRDADFVELDSNYIQQEEFVTSINTSLDEAKYCFKEIRKGRDWLRISYLDLVEERDRAHRNVLDLKAQASEKEAEVSASFIPAAELTENVRKSDMYQVILQFIAVQDSSRKDL